MTPSKDELMKKAGPGSEPGSLAMSEDELVQEITKFLETLNLGFDPHVLSILDDEDAGQDKIEQLKFRLTGEIASRLLARANSAALFGKINPGDVRSFTEAIFRLGMTPAKIYIFALAFFTLSPALEPLAAKSFARGIMARVLAEQMNFKRRFVDEAEIGALLMEIGKVPIILYQQAEGVQITEEFIRKHYKHFGGLMLERCGLSGSFFETIMQDCLSFYDKTFSVRAVTDIARMIVDDSFTRYRKFVIESTLAGIDAASTIGQFIATQFTAAGFGKYLEIRRPEGDDDAA